METKQKNWLWVSLIMFAMPEILWSPVTNIIYSFLQNSNHVKDFRSNFLTNPDNTTFLLIVLFIQLVGLVLSLVYIMKTTIIARYKISLFLLTLFVSIVTGFAFFIVFSLRNGIGF